MTASSAGPGEAEQLQFVPEVDSVDAGESSTMCAVVIVMHDGNGFVDLFIDQAPPVPSAWWKYGPSLCPGGSPPTGAHFDAQDLETQALAFKWWWGDASTPPSWWASFDPTVFCETVLSSGQVLLEPCSGVLVKLPPQVIAPYTRGYLHTRAMNKAGLVSEVFSRQLPASECLQLWDEIVPVGP